MKLFSFFPKFLYIFFFGLIVTMSSGFSHERLSPVELSLNSFQKEIKAHEPFWICLHFKIKEGWKVSRLEEESALFLESNKAKPKITWNSSASIKILQEIWAPSPKNFYENEIKIFFKIESNHDNPSLSAFVEWAACKDFCQPGKKSISIHFPLHDKDISIYPTDLTQKLFFENFLELALVFIGGILLNFMPCVLPVLFLKLLHLFNYKNHPQHAIKIHGIVFFLGVWFFFMILSFTLIGLKFLGLQAGWGFHMQSPLLIALMASLFTLLALNLFGVFEMGLFLTRIGKPLSSLSYTSSFLSGCLTTLVSAPCTGPFMGAAIGIALLQPWPFIIATFTFLALGVSFPFLIICLFPKLMSFLPKPGAWMEKLKQLFGFFMLGTVLWFLWIFSYQTTLDDTFLLLIGLLLLSASLWFFEVFKSYSLFLRLFLIIPILSVFLITLLHEKDYLNDQDGILWHPYSQKFLQEAEKKKQPILIDFTAKWCLTCQTNKKVLDSAYVSHLLKKKGVLLIRADWTKQDAEIAKALETYKRNSIPFSVIYQGTSKENYITLPPILTQESIKNALDSLHQN